MDVVRVLVRVPTSDIVLHCNLITSYEGMAIVRTVDPIQGLLELLVAPAFHTAILTLLQALTQETEITVVDPGF